MELIEAGVIVNTHGVRGAVKIEPWTDTPEFLCAFPRLFIGDKEHKVLSASVHKNHVTAALEGIETVQDAASLRGKTVLFEKSDAKLSNGEYFVSDLIGLDAVNDDTGESFGTISSYLSMPANGVYVIAPIDKSHGEMLIPAVPEFVKKIDVEDSAVRFHLMEGL